MELKRIITSGAMGLLAATVLLGCSRRETDECVVKRPVSDQAKSDPRVSDLVQRLSDPDLERRKEAAASLGKLGPAARAAVVPLYMSLSGQNVFEAVFDESYPGVVVKAIADIAREDAVPASLVAFLAAKDESAGQAELVIWMNVFERVGPPAVGCACQIVENNPDARIRSAYVRALGYMGARGVLKGKQARAEATLKKASGDADPSVRAAAEQSLAGLAKK